MAKQCNVIPCICSCSRCDITCCWIVPFNLNKIHRQSQARCEVPCIPKEKLLSCTNLSSLFILFHSVCVLCFPAVWIFSDKRAYASETDIQFVAVTEEPDPLYFHWKFGDGPEIKTTSRIYKKRYRLPDKYFFVSNGLTSISSDVYPLVIQRAVQPNRLLYSPSVLSHSFVNFTCLMSAGTDVSYVWNFGDGTERDGSSTEHHVYNRTGEYIVEVIMSNLVSSASLTGHIFVVEELCQPPPVKNMGPNKIQVWRYQTVHLAVTFEAQIQCNVSRGLLYRWTIYDMSGRQLLFPHIDMGRQYIDLPNYLLHYGTYKTIAKVQVTGSVVYSNYSVLIEVVRSHPVSVISEATNIFLNRQSGTIVTLDGRKSHDPDYPNNTIRYNINTEESSCFNRNIVTTSAVLTFPALSLKPDFDLLKFTLSVYSGHRSSSSETFITVTSKHVSNIHLSCKHFRENAVNWNEPFSVSALCDACGFNTTNLTYYWKLYLVNSSSKAVPESKYTVIQKCTLKNKDSLLAFVFNCVLCVCVSGTNSLGFSWNVSFPHSYDNEGDNLVDPSLHGPAVSEKTLLDLHRQLIHHSVFESYTLTVSEERLQGKSQLFFHTQAVPEGMSCQVQPNTGYEIHTYFSIFCSSGKEDLLYEYSFSVGTSPRKLLYEGRDFQHYFSLPSGDPNDDYKVTIYIEIKNRFGATTKPCPVKVTVLPSFQRNSSSQLNPDHELLGNLTGLSKIGSNRDIINYISLLIAVLNRLSLDADSSVTFYSAKQVIQHVHDISSLSHESKPPAGHILDTGMVKALVSLLSGVLEAPVLASRPGHQLTNKVLYTITDLVLVGEASLMLYIRLYNCTTRKEIKVRHLSTPVTIEFQRKEETNSPHARFTLLHGQVNTHQFNITSQTLQRALQITVQFNRPAERPFPILLLLRMYEHSIYLFIMLFLHMVLTYQIMSPINFTSLSPAAGSVYLRLLNADYNKSPSNKYMARAVNYTLRIESVECLSWDGVKEWKPSGCFPLGGLSADKIYYLNMVVFQRTLTDIFFLSRSSETNYILIISSVIFLALYVVVLVICRKADVSIQKTTGSFLLPENNPSDRFLYAVTIDTGLRSRTRMTAKVHIVLYGDKGVSQTRELSSSDSKLFTCNSRNTFILSSPESLGRVWKVHLWHDNGGSSPSWYLSHVVVKDLVQGSCWFFLGQCWLAVDEGDGRVERSLVFLYLKLTEYLEDHHPWLSVYSRPSFSSHTHTQRWSVCLLLLQGYMCVSAVLVNLLEEQVFNTEINTCQQILFDKTKTLLWAHSVFFSLVCCGFVLHPAMVNHLDPAHRSVYGFNLIFVLFVTYGKSDNDYKYHLNQAIKSHFTKSLQNSFHSIQKHDDWWNWTTTAFLERLYDSANIYFLNAQILNLLGKHNIKCSDNQSVEKRHSLCGKLGCYEGESVSVSLGKTRSDKPLINLIYPILCILYYVQYIKNMCCTAKNRSKAIKSIKKLLDTGWMTPFTQIVMVQFILYNGPSNLFTAVTILVEQTSTGALMPSASIQSTRLYHFPAALDYSVMTCELLFLLFILLHMYRQIYVMTQREWLYWRNLWSWLEVTLHSF
uniref:Polycystic kidney disease 1 like 1 n=1 Tax=Sinocyclocheilus rhinocerous TaxID=307959 RepID=A0A673G3S9_9TELE